MTYLLTGATGNVGSRVTRRLFALGHRPRLLVRDEAKVRSQFGDRADIHVGDLGHADSFTAALTGIEAVLLINTGATLAARDAAMAIAAARAGVSRIVKLSALSARESLAVGAWHAAGEAAIRNSGVEYAFIQPAGFMSNALTWAHSIKADGMVRASTGGGRVAYIHPEDIAAVAAQVLTTGAFRNESLPITGPELLSYAEMTAKISEAVRRPLGFEAISDEQAQERLRRAGMEPLEAQALAQLWRAVREGRLATRTEEVRRVLGREPLSFRDWASENASAFL